MKKFLMALVVLAIASAPALAGPNANGIIVVHKRAWRGQAIRCPRRPCLPARRWSTRSRWATSLVMFPRT